MVFNEFYKKLEKNKLYVFSLNDVLTIFPDAKKDCIKKCLYRWKKGQLIRSIKKGMYELIYPKEFFVSDLYLANKIYFPSYVSLETALSNYSIIPEVAMAVTSITTKPTRIFKNEHGLFKYRSIKLNAFCGYFIEKHRGFDVLMAEPEKALVDYVYFKIKDNKVFDIDAERLDKDIVSNLNRKNLNKYARQLNVNLKGLL